MSYGNPSTPYQSTPPSTSVTVAAESKLENAIQRHCKVLRAIVSPEDPPEDDDHIIIQYELGWSWFSVHNAISQAGDLSQKERLRNQSEFKAYVTPGSNGERKLIKLLRSMAKQEVPWTNLFKNGTFLLSL
jgi:hypothetical protein